MVACRSLGGAFGISALVALGGAYGCSSSDTAEPASEQDAARDASGGGRPDGAATGGNHGDGAADGPGGGGEDAPPADGGRDVSEIPDAPTDVDRADATDAQVEAEAEAGPTCGDLCASGKCDANDDCQHCVNDGECKGGRVCGSGICALPCDGEAGSCGGSFTCCNGHCVDTTRDPKYCGAGCGVACGGDQFCSSISTSSCQGATVANICKNATLTFIVDPFAGDQEAASVVEAAMASTCAGPPAHSAVLQASVNINPTTGQPVAGGGELLVAIGGDAGQKLVTYFESHGAGTIYNAVGSAPNTIAFWRRGGEAGADSEIIKLTNNTAGLDTHDAFVVQTIRDATSGSLAFIIYGFGSNGTQAGAYYFSQNIGTFLSTPTKTWYVYEWTDSGDMKAGAGDTYYEVASGP